MKQITGTISLIFLGPYYITKYHIYIYIYITIVFTFSINLSLQNVCVYIYIYIYIYIGSLQVDFHVEQCSIC